MRFAIAVAALLLVAPSLAAQYSTGFSLQPGDRIRLNGTASPDSMVDARVVAWKGESVEFSVDGDPDNVYSQSVAALESIDVHHRSRRGSARTGAVWGLYMGASGGIIGGALAAGSMKLEMESSIALFAGAGTAAGMLTGAAAGALIAPTRWYRYVFLR